MIKLIACVDREYGISRDGKIPWHLQEDLAFFRSQTINSVIIMGRHTYFSLPKRPLDNRINCVISRSLERIDKCDVVSSLEDAVTKYNDAWIIGGAMLYNAALQNNVINYALITVIDAVYGCDTFLDHSLLPSQYTLLRKGDHFKIRKYVF